MPFLERLVEAVVAALVKINAYHGTAYKFLAGIHSQMPVHRLTDMRRAR